MESRPPSQDLELFDDAAKAVARVEAIYSRSTGIIREAFHEFTRTGKTPAALEDAVYPYLTLSADPDNLVYDARPSWGTLAYPGVYGTTLTRPDIFADYYRAQIDRLMSYHHVPVRVGPSTRPIPLPFVIEESTADLSIEAVRALAKAFTLPNLTEIDDSIANGSHLIRVGEPLPLSLFTAERVDLALQRIHHYTATDSGHFQRFVLFTNYQRYVTAFAEAAVGTLKRGRDGYTGFALPENRVLGPGEALPPGWDRDSKAQMPAYHLLREDRLGVSLVNIGIGPSNAKTITDHLAVLRPHCWLMIGHCGGLRRSQQLGDYVLAHAYVRDDHVLDKDLPTWVPVPPIAEVQVALQAAVAQVTGLTGDSLKTRMRTGTVVTTDDRNWELSHDDRYTRFNQSRAIAIDMESATIAANGFRFRVPYGTLLCVSDKPLHGEIKLRGMANAFYRQRIDQHLAIGLEAIRLIRETGVERLHSRKLRSFDEPAFR
jgi:AMP nucleosidase